MGVQKKKKRRSIENSWCKREKVDASFRDSGEKEQNEERRSPTWFVWSHWESLSSKSFLEIWCKTSWPLSTMKANNSQAQSCRLRRLNLYNEFSLFCSRSYKEAKEKKGGSLFLLLALRTCISDAVDIDFSPHHLLNKSTCQGGRKIFICSFKKRWSEQRSARSQKNWLVFESL